MKEAIDNFSNKSSEYALYRPDSPPEVFDFLLARVPGFSAAWDCGTGNGQVARVLAERFEKVYGTDISSEQLSHATGKENISYLLERAEKTSLPDNSVDLITVAQAIHWFDFEAFYKEVRRVAVPGAVIAAWTYTVLQVNPAVDAVIDKLYSEITVSYWDKERKLVDAAYSTIPFPFDELETPVFYITGHYSLQQLVGYLRTWSGVKHYLQREGADPLEIVMDELKEAWGDAETHAIIWPVHMRAGRVV